MLRLMSGTGYLTYPIYGTGVELDFYEPGHARPDIFTRPPRTLSYVDGADRGRGHYHLKSSAKTGNFQGIAASNQHGRIAIRRIGDENDVELNLNRQGTRR